jgi:hypothetical protein
VSLSDCEWVAKTDRKGWLVCQPRTLEGVARLVNEPSDKGDIPSF